MTKTAKFHESKRDFVMEVLNIEPSEVMPSGHIKGGVKNIRTPAGYMSPPKRAITGVTPVYTSGTKRVGSPKPKIV